MITKFLNLYPLYALRPLGIRYQHYCPRLYSCRKTATGMILTNLIIDQRTPETCSPTSLCSLSYLDAPTTIEIPPTATNAEYLSANDTHTVNWLRIPAFFRQQAEQRSIDANASNTLTYSPFSAG